MTRSVVSFDTIPDELKSLNQWVLWGEGKIPLSINGKRASSTKKESWSSFKKVREAYESNAKFQGIGFVFTPEDEICGIDLDDAFKADGSLKNWAFSVLSTIGCGYVECSPSGTGLHVFILAEKPGSSCKRIVTGTKNNPVGEIELYDRGRYFTVTGHIYDASLSRIEEAQQQLNYLYEKLFPSTSEEKLSHKENEPDRKEKVSCESKGDEKKGYAVDSKHVTPLLSADDIRTIITRGSQGEKFRALESGDITAYADDRSRAVYGFSSIVAFYTSDFQICDELFRASGLYTDAWAPSPNATGAAAIGKWQRLGRIQFEKLRRGLEAKGDVYDPQGRSDPGQDFNDLQEEQKQKERSKGLKDFDKYIGLMFDMYEEARKDLISGALHVRRGDDWQPVFQRDVLSALRGECQLRKGYKKSYVEDYLYLYQAELQKQLLIDIPTWDGVDRIGVMASKLSFDTNKGLGLDAFECFLRDWLAKLYGRIFNPDAVQNRCIILSGSQGIGKDVWIKSLLCGLNGYLADFSFDGKLTKESDMAVVMGRSLCMFISEFDKTHDLGAGVLKDLITKTTFTQVRKYDREASRMENRCSIIAACNPENILKDATGNRRFLVFRLAGGPGEAISWDYPMYDKAYSLQVLGQARALFESGYRVPEQHERDMEELIRHMTPDNPIDELIEEFESGIERLSDPIANNGGLFGLQEIDTLLANLATAYGTPRRTILGLLKGAGCQLRTAAKRYYGTRERVRQGLLLQGHSEDIDERIEIQ